MQVVWALEENTWDEQSYSKLVESIKKNPELEYYTQKSVPDNFCANPQNLFSNVKEDACVIFYGSLGLAGTINRVKPGWVPALFYPDKIFDCLNYYSYFSKVLLNNDYIMLPYGELLRRKEFIFNVMSEADAVFIRPSSGNKTFTGKLVYKENFNKDVEMFGFYEVRPEDLKS